MKEEKRLALMMSLLIILLVLAACSKDTYGDDGNELYQNPVKQDSVDQSPILPNVNLSGYYSGEWMINYKKTEVESLGYIWVEKASLQPNSYINKNETHPSFIEFIQDEPRLDFQEFPFKSLPKLFYPNLDIKYVSYTDGVGHPSPSKEMELMSLIVRDAREEGAINTLIFDIFTIPLSLIGWSENMLYYNLREEDGFPYKRFLYVITTWDDDYFVVILDILPSKSTVTFDISSETMVMSLCIHQVEFLYQDLKKINISLEDDIIVLFISNTRSNEMIYK